MKFLINSFTIALLMISSFVTAQTSITVTVNNISSDKGKVSFALYDAATFMKQPLQGKNSKIENGKSVVVFENVPAGEYAIICFHDKNDNNQMDFQPNGMPLENYGVSNNKISYGPPNFTDGKFTVSDKEVSLEIKF